MLFALLCVVFPFVGALLTPAAARLGPRLRDVVAVSFSGLTALSALALLPLLSSAETLPLEAKVTWLESPITISAGLLLDPLSIVMTCVVAVISFFIMIYCLGYMKGNPAVVRFWMLMNSFIGSMLLLVLANNLILLFIGWKLVGLCSFGLISFNYRDEQKYWIGGPAPHPFQKPTFCATKALLVTSLGDMLMLGGFLIIYSYAGTFDLLELYQTAPEWLPQMADRPWVITLVALLLIAGPIGKSAQFPLHEWLPEAMSGPGPVSALIHAATMVKSGVFLVARLIPIFYYGYWVAEIDAAMDFFVVVAWVGAITAFLAATQAVVALELKKVLAYSTVSQIGFMMLALGVSGFSQGLLVDGYAAGILHLVSHAMFKACLFLCAATVIKAAGSLYIHEMGAMRALAPTTWIFMSVAALSLMGVPPFPGFWSKEAVLLVTLEAGQYSLFATAVATAGLTAFYTVRAMGMVFHGPQSEQLRAQPQPSTGDGYRPMRIACGALAAGIVALGPAAPWLQGTLEGLFAGQLVDGLAMPVTEHVREFSTALVISISVGALLLGAVPAYMFFIARRWDAEAVFVRSAVTRTTHRFLWRRWYIDPLYQLVFQRGVMRLASFVSRVLENAMDALINRGIPRLAIGGGNRMLELARADGKDLASNVTYLVAVAAIFVLIALLSL